MTATVLAIDDSPPVLGLLAVRLKHDQLRLITACTGEQGFEVAVAERPDLILLDVDLPRESGLEWCRRLKNDERTANIPVIFLTASEDVTTKVNGFDVGAVDYVVKSCHPAELRARVRSALRLKRIHDMLSERALVDSLTGLRNRTYFDNRLDDEVVAARRDGRDVSLVMADLDHFKRLNDSYGHPFGDEVLARAAEILAGCVRPVDAACRFGGEELALILTSTSLDAAQHVAERARSRLVDATFISRGERVSVTASFGIAGATELRAKGRVLTPRTLLGAADEALYVAKRNGRNRVCFDASALERSAA